MGSECLAALLARLLRFTDAQVLAILAVVMGDTLMRAAMSSISWATI